MTPVRLGLIGVGVWGRNYVRAAKESGEAEVVCGMASSPGARDGVMMYGANPSHYEDMAFHAGGLGVDAFVVARNPAWAAGTCERLLALGKPILVEKPAGLSLTDAQRIAAAETSSSAFVLVGHQHLFAAAYLALRQMVKAVGAFDIRSVGANRGPVRDYSALWDYGPHDVAMALGMPLGRPLDVDCRCETTEAGETYHLRLRLERGSAYMRVGNGATNRQRTFAVEKGRWFASYDDLPSGPILRSSEGPIGFDHGQPLTNQVRAFAKAVRGGERDWRFGAHWAVDVARILAAAEMSCVTGRPEPVDSPTPL